MRLREVGFERDQVWGINPKAFVENFECSQIVDGKLDLDMNALREKVHSLYSFPFGSELVLTYIDEDKDVVTLADEEDLNDIVRQSLNPLRITVKLNAKKTARSHTKSSGNVSPVREPEVQIPLQVKSTSATDSSTLSAKTTSDTLNGTGGGKQDKGDNFRLHDKCGNRNTGSSEGNKVGSVTDFGNQNYSVEVPIYDLLDDF
ncbi:hypothetical protein AgCh_003272 [Apium graveolens]